MSIFYNSLPLPLYLAITLVIPVLILAHLTRSKNRYNIAFMLSMVFLSLTGLSTGLIRIANELKLQGFPDWFKDIPILLVVLTVVFVWAGAYQKVRHDEVKRRQVLILSVLTMALILVVVMIVILKSLEN